MFCHNTVKNHGKTNSKINEKLIPGTERSSIIKESISKNGFIAVCKNENEIIGLANEIAPEHMELMVKNAKTLSKKITGAGLLLIGKIHHLLQVITFLAPITYFQPTDLEEQEVDYLF